MSDWVTEGGYLATLAGNRRGVGGAEMDGGLEYRW